MIRHKTKSFFMLQLSGLRKYFHFFFKFKLISKGWIKKRVCLFFEGTCPYFRSYYFKSLSPPLSVILFCRCILMCLVSPSVYPLVDFYHFLPFPVSLSRFLLSLSVPSFSLPSLSIPLPPPYP